MQGGLYGWHSSIVTHVCIPKSRTGAEELKAFSTQISSLLLEENDQATSGMRRPLGRPPSLECFATARTQ
jgi:hypothetical protein